MLQGNLKTFWFGLHVFCTNKTYRVINVSVTNLCYLFPSPHKSPQTLLSEVVAERDSVEELNDICEILMEHSGCSKVRDETVETQANYTKLLTSVQGNSSVLVFFVFTLFVIGFYKC